MVNVKLRPLQAVDGTKRTTPFKGLLFVPAGIVTGRGKKSSCVLFGVLAEQDLANGPVKVNSIMVFCVAETQSVSIVAAGLKEMPFVNVVELSVTEA